MDSKTNPYTFPSLEGQEEALAKYTYYDTAWERGNLQVKKDLYAKMPNIETLYLRVEGFLNNDFYLRPSIKTIHLDFRMFLNQKRKYTHLDFACKEAYLDWFNTIEKYLQEHPDSQLEELHIQFMPEVIICLCIANYHTVDYDEGGPIYEDEDWSKKTTKHNPSEYLFSLTQKSYSYLDEIGDALLRLLALRGWKAITLPYDFPSAEMVGHLYPFSTFTDKVDEKESIDRTYETIQEFHREHREQTPKLKA